MPKRKQRRRKQPDQQQPLRRSTRLLHQSQNHNQQQQRQQSKRNKSTEKVKTERNQITNENNLIVEQNISVKTGLGNYVVLTQILKKLRTRDLLICRLVNRQWNDLSTTILRRRSDIQVDLRYLKELNTFVLNRVIPYRLDKLNSLLEKSNKFPCTNFLLLGTLSCLDVQEFLTVYGKEVRKLKLHVEYCPHEWKNDVDTDDQQENDQEQQSLQRRLRTRHPTKLTHLRELLLYQCPNLENLSLEKIPKEWSEHVSEKIYESKSEAMKLLPISPLTKQLRTLPNLKKLTLEDCPIKEVEWRWLKEILDAAVHLQSFNLNPLSPRALEVLSYWNKLHFVKKLDLMVWRMNPVIVEKYAEAPLFLKSLDLSTFPISKRDGNMLHVRRVFSKILEKNRESLKSLALEANDNLFCLKNSIIFKNVRKLLFSSYNLDVDGDFKEISLPVIFPKLKFIYLSGNRDGAEENEKNFPFTTPIPTVTRMEIESECPNFWLKRMPAIFPNLVFMKIQNYWDFPDSASLIWGFSSLKYLHVEFYGAENLDSSLTGLPIDLCKRLRTDTSFALNKTKEEIEQLREFPSIINLKNLRELRLDIVNDPNDMDENDASSLPNYDVISPVSSTFAFDLMPELKLVEIAIVQYEPIFIPSDKGYKSRLEKLEAAVAPMASHPKIKLLKSK